MIECPPRLTLGQHLDVLEWITQNGKLTLDLGRVQNVHIWALVALATLAIGQKAKERNLLVRSDDSSAPSRFAHAVGFDGLTGGTAPSAAVERGRTVRMRRIQRFDEIETVASQISRLIQQEPDTEDTRQTLYYILVEFLRNAVQHSRNPEGAIVGAQLMDKTAEYEDRPMIQIAVGDAGIGVMESLRATYPETEDVHQALMMAQQPWVSSRFHAGSRGDQTNAGLGLFFISEMAKKTAGRFLLSSHGGSVLLEGDPTYQQHHHIRDERYGFPGTLVVFELPVGEIEDYQGLIAVIQDLARERIPARMPVHWIRFEPAARDALSIVVRFGAEDTAHAQTLVNEHLLPRVARGQSIELDFARLAVCTQSYLHTLLFSVLRDAYVRRVPIHVTNASRAVRSSIEFLQSYALNE